MDGATPNWIVELLRQLPAEWGLLGLVAWLLYQNKVPRSDPHSHSLSDRVDGIDRRLLILETLMKVRE